MSLIRFAKMNGAGNDYIYVDSGKYSISFPEDLAIRWSDRHHGIGSDGLVLIDRSADPEADFTMRIFNADGSEAMMCGNAARCVAKYVHDKGLTDKRTIRLATRSGIRTLSLHLSGNRVESVTVDMSEPALSDSGQFDLPMAVAPDIPLAFEGRSYRGTFVSMGNPHFVIFTEDAEKVDLSHLGAGLERHPAFPARANIEFASVLPDGRLRMRVWERGSGVTMACGTGACATVVAANVTARARRRSRVIMDGGELDIEWRDSDNHVYMTGPAELSYEGEIEI